MLVLAENCIYHPARRVAFRVSLAHSHCSSLCRCRVDFTTSQTRTERINLKVIVRPSRPQIYDDAGTVRDIFAGPYQEGSDVMLSCRVVGGRPPPRVVWYKNFQLLSEQYVRSEDRSGQMVTFNNLTLVGLPR